MSKPVILCVDDERIILDSLKSQIVHHFGSTHQMEVAESGEEALEILEDLKEEGRAVPLIIVDQIMGGMYGDELIKHIRPLFPQAKTIMLTGQASAEAVGSAFNDAGLFRYMSKPWEEEDLILSIKMALQSYQDQRELELTESHQSSLRQILELALEPIPFVDQVSQALRAVLITDEFESSRKGAIYIAKIIGHENPDLLPVVEFNGGNQPQSTLQSHQHLRVPTYIKQPDGEACFCAPILLRGVLVGLMYVYLNKDYESNQHTIDFLTDACNSLAGIVRLSQYHLSLEENNKKLEGMVKERTEQLSESLRNQERLNDILLNANKKLDRFATTDELTQLYNRRHFFKLSNEIITATDKANQPCVLVMLDIDYFKEVNDTYGHQTGDTLLHKVAATIKNNVRKHDVLARIGGEEFAILMPETSVHQATELCERLKGSISDTMLEHKGNVITVTASFGISIIANNEKSVDKAMLRADQALYGSKNKGRNTITKA